MKLLHLFKFNSVVFFILFFLLTGVFCYSQEAKPIEVFSGIYVNQIYDVSLKENKFSADFYIWFRWKGDGIDPIKTFELANGRIESRENESTSIINGFNYSYARINATFQKFWDIKRFPLDNHIMTFEIEDSANEETKVKFIPDKENCGLNPKIEVPGWKIAGTEAAVLSHTYKSNYGDITLPVNSESIYSQFTFSVKIDRPGMGYFLKLFFGVFIAAFLSFLVFFIKPTDLDPRFGLGVGAIFAAVASEYVISSSLPDTNIITLADKLHILAFAFIFLSIAESIISLTFFTNGKENISKFLDKFSFIMFSAVYTTLTVIFVLM